MFLDPNFLDLIQVTFQSEAAGRLHRILKKNEFIFCCQPEIFSELFCSSRYMCRGGTFMCAL